TAQLGTVINLDTQTFLDGQASPELQHEEKLNIFIHQRRDIQVNIQVSNVHRDKRETHTATLYLETFYRKYDIKAIVNYMKGIYTLPGTATLRNSLKMAYVGMTRPTHMLCVAAHKDSCEDHLQDLVRAGWEVHRV
ncbi:MAG TPA: hypothetical protein VEZ72_12100, partial [Paenibacillus sp.]|nr:hypothetical protein [Paenibacillus sp.]